MITHFTKEEVLNLYKMAIDIKYKELSEEQQHSLDCVLAAAIVLIDNLWPDKSKSFYLDRKTGKCGFID